MGSIASHKPYHAGLDKQYDTPARRISCEFLETRGLKLEIPWNSQPVAYHLYDYIIRDLSSGENKKVECEVKTVWTLSGDWPRYWKTVDIPNRKSKSQADCFIIVNNSGDTLAFISGDDVRNAAVIRKDTDVKASQQRTKNEKFFGITLDKVRFFTKMEGTWKEFKL